MNTNRWISLILFALFLSGCSSATASPIARPTDIVMSSPTSTEQPPLLTATPLSIPIRETVRACIVQNNDKQGLTAQGVLVLQGYDFSNSNSSAFLYHLDRKVLAALSSPRKFENLIGVSPDRKKLLYEYDGDSDMMLAVSDFRGKLVGSFSYEMPSKDFLDYVSWLNSDVLRGVQLLNLKTLSNKSSKTTSQATAEAYLGKHLDIWGSVSLYRYNPVTGDYGELSTDWPDIYKGKGLDWSLDSRAIDIKYFYGANIIYDPTLTRLVYPKNGENISLTDAESGRELASTHLTSWGRLPRWSEDGRKLVLIGNMANSGSPIQEDFFIVSGDGVGGFQRLTHLASEFDHVYIADYAWSPDGQQLAFWLNTSIGNPSDEGESAELAILNVNTGEVTNLCVQGISMSANTNIEMIHSQPVWSPDGSQVMITQLNPTNSKKYNVLIVDIAGKAAYKLVENLEPIGWMTTEP